MSPHLFRIPGKNPRRCGSRGAIAALFLLSGIAAAPFNAVSQAASDAEQLRQELRQLKQEYQQRIDSLEERLRQLESASALPVTNAVAPPSVSQTRAPSPATATSQETSAVLAARKFADDQFQAGRIVDFTALARRQ